MDQPDQRASQSGHAPAAHIGWLVADSAKRIVDLLVAVPILLIASPILLVAAALVRAETTGPILYRRQVVGLGGREFDAYKLRTMKVDADKQLALDPAMADAFLHGKKMPRDPRVTRVGGFLRKYSIDELPQLANVLLGQMSLVGPRMRHASELPALGDTASALLSVKPGLTGLWQVSGRQELDAPERVRLDLEYLRTRSVRRDIGIMLRTVPAILSGRGAY